MSSAKDKPSGTPAPSNPATTSSTQRRHSSGGSQTTNSEGARVKFEDEQKPEVKDETKYEPEENPSLPVIKEGDSENESYYVNEDDGYQGFYQEEEKSDFYSPQSAVYSFTTPQTSPDFPPGDPPMVTSASVNHAGEPSPPLPPYVLFNGTLLLLGTLLFALVNSYPVTSLSALFFSRYPASPLGHRAVPDFVSISPADPVAPGLKALAQLATVVERLYFTLELYKDLFGYKAPGDYLLGGYRFDVGLGDFGLIDMGPLQQPRWPHATRVMATRGTGVRQEDSLLETVDKLVSAAAGAGVVVIISLPFLGTYLICLGLSRVAQVDRLMTAVFS
ncbi:hypothetical protein QBC36DRAFT_375869 [Triangularia setosa]|uniref:Uncharacterized protein n=1 Tax=Triangularia setosa TaxID=2587417 RepID=A0AAN6WD69_9PEZI|nr:hypothetical protein QBC36DRAFT_375869 [Podospora setosa]